MADGSVNEISTFAEARERLEEIVDLVRDKDLPLEKSLDLFEEAIKLGNRCSDLIDDVTFSPEKTRVPGTEYLDEVLGRGLSEEAAEALAIAEMLNEPLVADSVPADASVAQTADEVVES